MTIKIEGSTYQVLNMLSDGPAFNFTHCGCYFTDDDPTLASNDKCSAFDLYEACERALHCIENAYSQQIGLLDMNSAVGKDITFIRAAMANARGESNHERRIHLSKMRRKNGYCSRSTGKSHL